MTVPRLQVLLVDDEAAVLATTAAVLSEDFEVHTASDALTARRLLGLHPFDVLCTDLHMPGPSGIQLLREAVTRYPHLAGVLVTGSREYLDWRDRLDAQGLFYLVLKPYQPSDLIAMIRRAAGSARLMRDMSRLTSGLAEHKWGPR